MEEIYISTDIESDGPIPGPNSMLSFGSAAFTKDGELIDTFTRNLETLPGASPDPGTAAWWKTQPEAWAACRENLVSPKEAMDDFVTWLKWLPGKPVFVGYPATFDFMFVHWYLVNFTGNDPMSFSGLDMKSFAMAKLGTTFKSTTKANMPDRWFTYNNKHSHVALEDAIEQGYLFLEMLKEK